MGQKIGKRRNERAGEELVNRTKGFVNLNRFKSGRAIKRFKKVADRYKSKVKPGRQA
jgi:hypothetical protein